MISALVTSSLRLFHHLEVSMHYRHFQGSVKQEYLGKSVTENTGTGEKNTSYNSNFVAKAKRLKFSLL